MRTSSFVAKVVVAAAALTLLGAAPASADTYKGTFNTKAVCQWQAAIASSRGFGMECRAVRDGPYHTKWQLWIVDEWKYW